MYNQVNQIITLFKYELETNIPFNRSEIMELTKPSMMGNSGLSYIFDTNDKGISVSIWDSGFFEISNDIIKLDNGDNFFFSYVTEKIGVNYPVESTDLFLRKINDLLFLINKQYSNVKRELIIPTSPVK